MPREGGMGETGVLWAGVKHGTPVGLADFMVLTQKSRRGRHVPVRWRGML